MMKSRGGLPVALPLLSPCFTARIGASSSELDSPDGHDGSTGTVGVAQSWPKRPRDRS
jgi:hypothetical protein